MFSVADTSKKRILASALALGALAPWASVQARTFTVLYAFDGQLNDLGNPIGLSEDKAGNLYGVTDQLDGPEFGAAYALAPNGTLTNLFSFVGGDYGGLPNGPLIACGGGSYCGTAQIYGQFGGGVVFRITSGGGYSVLWSFDGVDGAVPLAPVVQDKNGNLYGTTSEGGADNAGVVFKLTPKGKETVLWSFTGGSDGGNPYAPLLLDRHGNLYGTTYSGGASGDGTVFELAQDGTQLNVYSFTGGAMEPTQRRAFSPTTDLSTERPMAVARTEWERCLSCHRRTGSPSRLSITLPAAATALIPMQA